MTRADCREEEGSIISYGTQGHSSESVAERMRRSQ